MRIDYAISSRIGRRERNEDACGGSLRAGAGCWVLADGAGGHGGGDVAARVALDAVLGAFEAVPEPARAASRAGVARLVHEANARVLEAQREAPALSDMRAALVTVVIDLERSLACWAHLGDARLYLLRAGRVRRRTRDHTLVQALADAGLLDPGAAAAVSRSVLTASLGGPEGFEPSVAEAVAIEPGDAFLLASDGLWERLEDVRIALELARAATPADWIARLEAVVERAAGAAQDNYSAVAVWCGRAAARPDGPAARADGSTSTRSMRAAP